MNYAKKVAECRYRDPMNTWPDHSDFHRRANGIFGHGGWLFDEDCLRCWLEKIAGDAERASEGEGK